MHNCMSISLAACWFLLAESRQDELWGAAHELRGAALYDSLYSIGYHNDTQLFHAATLVHQIKCDRATLGGKPPRGCNATAWAPETQIDSVLDVGCSHGKGVSLLWHMGVSANGVDVSVNAIRLANSTRLGKKQAGRCVYQPCFRPSSAALLPFPSRSFDAVMSTDVLVRAHNNPSISFYIYATIPE